jgi:hypothetical protein
MSRKREEARLAREAARLARPPAAERVQSAEAEEQLRDIQACLRRLGYRSDEARRAAEHAAAATASGLEERTRAALQFLGRRSSALCRVIPAPEVGPPPGVDSKREALVTSSPG